MGTDTGGWSRRPSVAAPSGRTTYQATMMDAMRFPIRLGRRSRPLLRFFGVRSEDDAVVHVDDTHLRARFGFGRVETPLANIVR